MSHGLLVVCVAMLAAFSNICSGASVGLHPQRLRCETLENPVGVDTARPRLAWWPVAQDPAARSVSQSAYQLLVATDTAILDKDRGDLWDSGKVASAETAVEYAGAPLSTAQTCWWKLRLWDQDGKPGEWSAPARWQMGVRAPADWHAKWITGSAKDPLPIFRKAFALERPIRQAVLYACGLGQHELYLNGQKVGNGEFEPAWSNYRKTCYYRAHDVTALLRRGENAMGALLGNGMYNVAGGRYAKFTGSFGPPRLILQLHVDFTDGTSAIIGSDKTWKIARSPIVFSCTYGGEDYDARLEQPAWDSPGFDDSTWSAAVEIEGPGGQLRWQAMPPVKLAETLPAALRPGSTAGSVYDTGRNSSAQPFIRIRGERGAVVKVTPGELLDDKGNVTQRSSGGPVSFTYTLRGDGEETWHPRFSYYGFRYMQVELRPPDGVADESRRPQLLGIGGRFIYNSSDPAGTFACSHDLVNRTHALILQALRSNFQNVLTDCPHREKLGWLECAHLLAGALIYNYDVANFYDKICRDMREAQLDSGLVPDTAPEYHLSSGGFRDSPEWGSAAVIAPWRAFQQYGDQRILRDNYATMKKYVQYLAGRSTDHIISHGLGDWYDVGRGKPGQSKLTSRGLTATAVYYQDLLVLRDTAQILGIPREAAQFEKHAAAVRESFNRRFFHPDSNQYDRNSQTANAMPLVLGLVPEDRRTAVLENLVRNIAANGYRVTAGDVGFMYVMRALCDNNRGDVLYKMVCQDTGPGYAWQLAHGATSLTEAWDTNPNSSQNHCMLGHAEEWFYRGLAGIQVERWVDGRLMLAIRPQVVGDLTWVRAAHDLPPGTLTSAWRREGSRLVLEISLPANTQAGIYLPAADASSVTESGLPAARAAGVKFLRMADGCAVFLVGSGTYRFESVRPSTTQPDDTKNKSPQK